MKERNHTHCSEYAKISRRGFLRGSLFTGAGALLGNSLWASAIPRVAGADAQITPRGDTLVCIFLRGAADVLNILVPYGDPGYYELRPTLAVARPDDVGTALGERAIDLDGFFGLHPGLSALYPIYQAGHVAFIHAAGTPNESRSHFETQDLMEGGFGKDYTGWLGRHLATLDTGSSSPLRAIGIGDVLQRSLITPIESGINPTALQSITTYGLHATHKEELRTQIEAFYAQDASLLHAIAQQILDTIERLSQLPTTEPGDYPQHAFGNQLRDTAQLIKADLGVELACLDLGGWDTHFREGAGGAPGAYLSRQLSILGQGLAAFYDDLDGLMDRVTLVVMSEFGRQLQENGSQGTDHGRGGFMMIMGNQVAGGQVFVNQGWQLLQDLRDQGEIDLNVLTDYRDVLGEILRLRLNNENMSQMFPDYTVTEHGLVTT